MGTKLNDFQKIALGSTLCAMIIIIIFLIMRLTVGKSLADLRTQNEELETQYATLEQYVLNRPTYEKETAENLKEIDKLVAKYDVKDLPENVLVDYKEAEDTKEFSSSSLSYNDPEEISLVSFTNGTKHTEYSLQKQPISISYTAGYDELLEYIATMPDKSKNEGLWSITLAYDEESKEIMGSMTVNKYIIDSEDREYESPDIDMNLGVDKLLGE